MFKETMKEERREKRKTKHKPKGRLGKSYKRESEREISAFHRLPWTSFDRRVAKNKMWEASLLGTMADGFYFLESHCRVLREKSNRLPALQILFHRTNRKTVSACY